MVEYLASRSKIGSVAGKSEAGSVVGSSEIGTEVGDSEFGKGSVAEDEPAGKLVVSTMHIWTGLSLQVAIVRKWASRRLSLPPHLAQISFCFLEVFCVSSFVTKGSHSLCHVSQASV